MALTPAQVRKASDRVERICASWPEVVLERDATRSYVTYRVRTRTFAYFLDNHHNDGRVAVWFKSDTGVSAACVASDPTRYFVPPYVGPRGWLAVRVDVLPVVWAALADHLERAYCLAAPATLVRAMRTANI